MTGTPSFFDRFQQLGKSTQNKLTSGFPIVQVGTGQLFV